MSVEIVEQPTQFTAAEARELTDEIRQTLRVGHDLIVKAFVGRAWTALGYESWDTYCAGEFSEARMVRLDREQRREIVAEMRQAGMSTRAIASGLGVGNKTVARDLASVSGDTDDEESTDAFASVERPTTVTSLDGRQRPATRSPREPVAKVTETTRTEHYVNTDTGEIADEPSAPAPDVSARRRRPLIDAFTDATYDLTKVTERIERLIADDRYPQNAEKVAAKHRSDLIRARDAMQSVIDRLPSA